MMVTLITIAMGMLAAVMCAAAGCLAYLACKERLKTEMYEQIRRENGDYWDAFVEHVKGRKR